MYTHACMRIRAHQVRNEVDELSPTDEFTTLLRQLGRFTDAFRSANDADEPG